MQKIKIGIVGLHQSGKSLLINCLLKQAISKVGTGRATTHTAVYYRYSADERVEVLDNTGWHEIEVKDICKFDNKNNVKLINVYIKNSVLKAFTLVDLPGTGYNNADNSTMANALADIDYAILLGTNEKEFSTASSFYANTLCLLKKHSIHYYFLLNCTRIDKWSPRNKQNIELAESDLEVLQIYQPLLLGDCEERPIINLMWYWCSLADSSDELYLKYYESIRGYFNHRGKDITLPKLKSESNFNLVEEIFDERNLSYLKIRRDFKNELEHLKQELCPIGTIQTFALYYIPDGWLPCDGRSLPIAEYPLLYNEIGITFGSENEDDFKLPNLCGRFVRGWDSIGEIDKHRTFGSEQDDTVQIHSHAFSASKLKVCNAGGHNHTTYADREDVKKPSLFSDDIEMVKWLNSSGSNTGTTSESGSHTHEIMSTSSPIGQPTEYSVRYSEETRPKNIALLFCIRYK